MHIPQKIPGLRLATVLLALYAVVWIGLEGTLWRVILLAVGVTLVAAGYMAQRFLGDRELTIAQWLLVSAVAGLFISFSSALLSLVFMAIKTGLHAHGPEFTADEIGWVMQQLSLWGLVGLLAGLGFGILLLGLNRPRR